MKTGLTLRDFSAKLIANRQLMRDYIIDTSKTDMVVQADNRVALMVPEHGEFPLRPLAHDQLGGRLKIPAAYYDRMLRDDPALLATNVNTWLQRTPEKRMLRTFAGDARAILSDRYQRIDNHEIAAAAMPVLAKVPDGLFVSSEITESRMYIQFVKPSLQLDVKVGDPVQAGVVVSNSEVGAGAARVQAMVWRLRCKNGLITADSAFRAYHVGRQVEDSAELWKDDTRAADDRAVLLKLRDMIDAALSDLRFTETVDKMRGLTELTTRKGNPVKAVEVLAQRVGMSDEEEAGLLRSLMEGGDLSAWGMLNAVTAQAHTAVDYDRSVQLEQAGGELLNLPSTEWKRIMETA